METWTFKKEDQGLTLKELDLKYANDPLYWKDRYENTLESRDAWRELYESQWNMPMHSTCYRTPPDDPNRHPDWDKVEVPKSVNDIKHAVIDVSMMTYKPAYMSCTKFEQLEEHMNEVNKYYREYTGEDSDYYEMNDVLQTALEMGVDIMIGNITDEIVDYADTTWRTDFELYGWQRQIQDWHDPKEEEPSNVIPIKSGDAK